MAGSGTLGWFRNISIAKKLYFAVGIMALLIAVELFTLWFSINTLSSLRAYVEGEGLWSKGQKDAIYHLQKYSRTHNEKDYQKFLKYMKAPLGDHKARVELLKPDPDMTIARQGFMEGRNDPADVDPMIKLFRRFHQVYYINKAIQIWGEADPLITRLLPIGEKLHEEINSPAFSQQKVDQYIPELESINDQLTVLEDNFSYTLGEGSRWLEHLVLKLLFIVALTVEISGLILTISVSRGIQKGLNEIIKAAKAIGNGKYITRARAFSKDEIGILAGSFNHMADELERSLDVQTNYAKKLEQSNSSLEQFAYVASHDLQEPLRTITNFVGLLKEKNTRIDTVSRRYMDHVVHASNRMKELIKDMLLYSRVGKYHTEEATDCLVVLNDILSDMELFIRENNASVYFGYLPIIQANKTEIHLLFQNLINNAIKYGKKDLPPVVEIKAVPHGDRQWLFSVSDNGIGIDNRYIHKIFIIFQRLHNESEFAGTGIGLATCKKIVELNEGSIWVESEYGKGSTFYFTLPK